MFNMLLYIVIITTTTLQLSEVIIMTFGAIKDDLLHKSLVAVEYSMFLIEEDLTQYIAQYYGGYSPILYKRTGNLAQTPFSPVPAHNTGSGAAGTVGLNTGIGYSTGTWTMENVISSAENGLHGGYPYGASVPFWTLASGLMQTRVYEGCNAAGF